MARICFYVIKLEAYFSTAVHCSLFQILMVKYKKFDVDNINKKKSLEFEYF